MRGAVVFVLCCSAASWAQNRERIERFEKTAPAAQGATRTTADPALALLNDVNVTKGPGGWICKHANGKACSGKEVELLQTTVNKSRSNVKDNLNVKTGPAGPAGPGGVTGAKAVAVLLDVTAEGNLKCTNTTTKQACSDTDMQPLVNKQWMRNEVDLKSTPVK